MSFSPPDSDITEDTLAYQGILGILFLNPTLQEQKTPRHIFLSHDENVAVLHWCV